MDLQASNGGCMFYKTKLQLHNLTFFCLDTRAGFCYVWNETSGTLAADRFAWLRYRHLKRYPEDNRNVTTLVIWSNGCDYKNRNATMANSQRKLRSSNRWFLFLAFHKGSATQCDSMHGVLLVKGTQQVRWTAPERLHSCHAGSSPEPEAYHVEELLTSETSSRAFSMPTCNTLRWERNRLQAGRRWPISVYSLAY